MLAKGPRDCLREALAIDGEGGTGRHTARFGRAHDERAEPAHLLFQQTDRVVELVAPERVAADELGEPTGLMHYGGAIRTHFVQRNRDVPRPRNRSPDISSTQKTPCRDAICARRSRRPCRRLSGT